MHALFTPPLLLVLVLVLTSEFKSRSLVLLVACAEQRESYDFNIHLPPYHDLRARRIPRVEQAEEFAKQKRGILARQKRGLPLPRHNGLLSSRQDNGTNSTNGTNGTVPVPPPVPPPVVPVVTILPTPGQPTHTISNDLLGGFEIVGNSGVSAQQMFLGTENLVYILDKTENNPLIINAHAAWGTVYDLTQNTASPLEVTTNTFCAGGGILGNGDWVAIGGNQAVDPGGNTSLSQNGTNVYHDSDGTFAVRTITPGVEGNWYDDPTMDLSSKRWYPTLEPMIDGRIFILGGDQWGGFVNDVNNSNPTYEFWPPLPGEAPIGSPILLNTLPANLYPIAHLLPTNTILLNINRAAAILDTSTNSEYPLPEVPYAVRTYPASASSVMLPLTVENGWNATVMYCGGSDISKDDWLSTTLALVTVPASASCISISPSTQNDFVDEDPLPVGRVMGNAVLLPDGNVLVVNGANTGVAGYAGNPAQQAWSVDDGFADRPVLRPVMYYPARESGLRWSDVGLQESTVPRMYHSSATLLPDGSVLVAGSNPHPDYSPNKTYPTEYRVERFYPLYYSSRRPEPAGIPSSISYGGSYFDLTLTLDDLFDNITNVENVKIVLMKTGYSTHAINFGMRLVELDHSFTINLANSTSNSTAAANSTANSNSNSTSNSNGNSTITGITLHVSQAPPNPAILPPGTAWFYVVVNGIPSVGVQVMVGNGVIGAQPTNDVEALPESSAMVDADGQAVGTGGGGGGGGGKSAARRGSVVFGERDAVIKCALSVVAGLLVVSAVLLS